MYIYVYKINWNNTLEYDYAEAIRPTAKIMRKYLFVWHWIITVSFYLK